LTTRTPQNASGFKASAGCLHIQIYLGHLRKTPRKKDENPPKVSKKPKKYF
jgi:hypothetical protein